MSVHAPTPDSQAMLTLFGWLALIKALQLINERDREFRVREINSPALADYVARRRDALLHFHSSRWTPLNP